MTLVLVAHGTRDPAGAVEIDAVAAALRARLNSAAGGVPVEVAYADVREPGLTQVLRDLSGPAVVVPAFLASGYHVRVDVPAQVADSGRGGVVISDPLGPANALTAAMHDRLVEAGWQRGDRVVLAAAGSSDPRALADVRRAAILLSARTGGEVRPGYVTTAAPLVPEAVDACRGPGGRVAVASWLLAPGQFQRSLADSGADVVAEPIGAHPRLVDLILRRYYDARCYHQAA
jgi:sirohydrochlorin ferrochelatase